ncbi:MAG: DUF58 domain-containing protein, partial [Pseudomonadota bacterium]
MIALICLAGIAGQWAEVEIPWWRFAFALLVIALAYEWIRMRSIIVVATSDSVYRLCLGRREELSLHLTQTGGRDIRLSYAATLPAALQADGSERTVTLDAQTPLEIKLVLLPRDLGEHLWSRMPVLIRGHLGLAWWPRQLDINAKFCVEPDLAGSQHRAVGEVNQGNHARQVGTGLELHHLRDYVPGDPLHHIDWKATARSQNLVTRVFSDEQHLDIMLVLDLGRTCRSYLGGLSQFAHYINLSARFAEIAASQGDAIGLLAVAEKPLAALPPAKGMVAVSLIRQTLGTLRPGAGETDLIAAGVEVQRLLKRRSLIVLLTDFYGQALDGLMGRSLRLWQSRHQTIVVGLLGDDVQQLQTQQANASEDAFAVMAATDYSMELQMRRGRRAFSVRRPTILTIDAGPRIAMIFVEGQKM